MYLPYSLLKLHYHLKLNYSCFFYFFNNLIAIYLIEILIKYYFRNIGISRVHSVYFSNIKL